AQSAAPPIATGVAPGAREPADEEIRLSGSGLSGTLPEGEVDRVLAQHEAELLRCHAVARPPGYVGGALTVKLRVSRDGKVGRAQIEESSLGHWPTERCVLETVRTLRFPPPSGGEAEVAYPLNFPARSRAADWPPARLEPTMARHLRELARCPDA